MSNMTTDTTTPDEIDIFDDAAILGAAEAAMLAEPDDAVEETTEQETAETKAEEETTEETKQETAEPAVEQKEAETRISQAHAEIAQANLELRQARKQLEQQKAEIEAMMPTAEEAKANPLHAFARLMGESDPVKAYEMMTHQMVKGGIPDKPPGEQPNSRLSALEKQLEDMKAQAASAQEQAQVAELNAGVAKMIREGAETFPILNGLGVNDPAETITHEINRVYKETGEVLQAADLIKRMESNYMRDLKQLVSNDAVKKALDLMKDGVTEQALKEQPPADKGDETPSTLTNQSAGAPPEGDDDYWLDDDAIVARATAASKG